jgi:hypothetical protein
MLEHFRRTFSLLHSRRTTSWCDKKYLGCSDKSLPIDKEEIYINSELYFAKKIKELGERRSLLHKDKF